jgi:plastocyanin
MKLSLALQRRLRWLNLPTLSLLALLQRTPVLRIASSAGQCLVSSPIGTLLRSAAATAASVGAMNSLVGATPLIPSVGSETGITVAVGTPVSVAYTIAPIQDAISQWTVSGSVAPGLSFSGLTSSGSVMTETLMLSGTPTTAGSYNVTLSCQDALGFVSAGYSYTVTVTGASSTAPAFTTQPASQTVTAGANVTFTAAASGSPTPTYQWKKDGANISSATSATFSLTNVQLADAATYTVVATNSVSSVTSNAATLTVNAATSAPSFTTQPASQTVAVGANVTFTAAASGSPTPTYQWKKDGTNVSGATSAALSLTNVQLADAATYTVVATNSVNSVTSNAAVLTVSASASAPSFTTQPASQTVNAGANVTFTAAASGSPVPTYQWKKSGTDIPGATGATLTLTSVTTNDAGTYTVVATNSVSSVTSNAAVLTVSAVDTSGSYLANLSVRVAMATGQTLIVGFVVDGGAKPILVRAAGPVLNKYGLTGVVDPQLTLFTGGGTQVAANDNWDAALATTFATLGAFPFDTGSKDAALQQTISGPHSAQATATGPGALLVEAYDVGPNDGRKLVNLSTRFQVGTGDNILIVGFVVAGTGSKQLLIRAVGPTLASYGVPGTLVDPQLGVFNSSGTQIASNDNWASTLSATFTTLGAFALNAGSKDAALVVTLQAGKAYSVQVSGVGGGTGEALAEIYVLP